MVEYRSGTSKSSSVAAQPTLLAPDDDETRGSEVQSGGLHAGDAHGSVSPKKVDAAETFSVSCAGAVPTESATQATACSPPVLSNQLPAVGTSDGLLHPIIGQASPLSEETIRALKTVILTLLSELLQLRSVTSGDILDWTQTESGALGIDFVAEEDTGVTPTGVTPSLTRKQRKEHAKAEMTPFRCLFGRERIKSVLTNLDCIEEVWHPKDKERNLTKAYRLLPESRLLTKPSSSRIVTDLQAALAVEQLTPYNGSSIVYQDAKEVYIMHVIRKLQGSVPAGRITEALSLMQPALLAAWLTGRSMCGVHNYILNLLVKEKTVQVEVLAKGRCRSMIRYSLPKGPPESRMRSATAIRYASKHLEQVAKAALPPRVVLPSSPAKKHKSNLSAQNISQYAAAVGELATPLVKCTVGDLNMSGKPPSNSTSDDRSQLSSRKMLRIMKHHSIILEMQ